MNKFSYLEEKWWQDFDNFKMHLQKTIDLLFNKDEFFLYAQNNDEIEFLQFPSKWQQIKNLFYYVCTFDCQYDNRWFEIIVIFDLSDPLPYNPRRGRKPPIPTQLKKAFCLITAMKSHDFDPPKLSPSILNLDKKIYTKEFTKDCKPFNIINWCKQTIVDHMDLTNTTHNDSPHEPNPNLDY